VRFKIDENVHVDVAATLRASGHDATTVHEQQMVGAPDRDLASVCRDERRALVTQDLDFADVRQYPPGEFHGLIVFRLARQDAPNVLAVVDSLLPLLDAEPLEGLLWIVEESRVRVRGRPPA
jgi:predicted nuclease of predicted toxin-antitoxin system